MTDHIRPGKLNTEASSPRRPKETYIKVFDEEFDKLVVSMMLEWRVPGVVIALVPDHEVPVYKFLYDKGSSEPLSAATLFPVASIGKVVSALALDYALEQAKDTCPKGWETRVKDVLPDFQLADQGLKEECTIMDLLCDQHSVPGWDVLLVESITQIPFERYIRETIFEPFGMDSSGFSAKARGKDAAMAHQLLSTSRVLGKEAEMVEIPQWCDASEVEVGMGSLSLISTLADLGKFISYFPKTSFWEKLSTPITDGPTAGTLRGIGMTNTQVGGYQAIGCQGACPESTLLMARIPVLEVGLVVLINSSEGSELASVVEVWVIERLGRVLG